MKLIRDNWIIFLLIDIQIKYVFIGVFENKFYTIKTIYTFFIVVVKDSTYKYQVSGIKKMLKYSETFFISVNIVNAKLSNADHI